MWRITKFNTANFLIVGMATTCQYPPITYQGAVCQLKFPPNLILFSMVKTAKGKSEAYLLTISLIIT